MKTRHSRDVKIEAVRYYRDCIDLTDEEYKAVLSCVPASGYNDLPTTMDLNGYNGMGHFTLYIKVNGVLVRDWTEAERRVWKGVWEEVGRKLP